MRWRLYHPPDWIPQHLEEILYRPPNGGHVRTGCLLLRDVRPDHHLVAVGRRSFPADSRDVFPAPGWKRERELMSIEADDENKKNCENF
jgi:hypothetical protein